MSEIQRLEILKPFVLAASLQTQSHARAHAHTSTNLFGTEALNICSLCTFPPEKIDLRSESTSVHSWDPAPRRNTFSGGKSAGDSARLYKLQKRFRKVKFHV